MAGVFKYYLIRNIFKSIAIILGVLLILPHGGQCQVLLIELALPYSSWILQLNRSKFYCNIEYFYLPNVWGENIF